ncbi:MAG: hypothetical protein RL194_1042 [Pseudomonadota bacterium]|jgi:hypothetical protein
MIDIDLFHIHQDGPSAWVVTYKGRKVGAITRGKDGYRAASMMGKYHRCWSLREAVEFIKLNTN